MTWNNIFYYSIVIYQDDKEIVKYFCFNIQLLSRAPSNLIFNVSRDEASTTSLGNL